VSVVEATESVLETRPELGFELREARRAPEFDETPVDVVSNLKVALVH
jgi:hypothetical protein